MMNKKWLFSTALCGAVIGFSASAQAVITTTTTTTHSYDFPDSDPIVSSSTVVDDDCPVQIILNTGGGDDGGGGGDSGGVISASTDDDGWSFFGITIPGIYGGGGRYGSDGGYGGGQGGGGETGYADTNGDGFADTAVSTSPGMSDAYGGSVQSAMGDATGGGTGGTGGGGCFVTTAVVATLGEADDGPTLTSLRRLRDQHTAFTENGSNRIDVYYMVAPEIVRRIELRPDSEKIWKEIYGQWINPIRTMVEDNKWQEADRTYGRMVKNLIWKYLILTLQPMPADIKKTLRAALITKMRS